MSILEDEQKLISSSVWQHKNNKKHYKLESSNVQLQENGIWIDAVSYRAIDKENIESDTLYVRGMTEFLMRFKCIEI